MTHSNVNLINTVHLGTSSSLQCGFLLAYERENFLTELKTNPVPENSCFQEMKIMQIESGTKIQIICDLGTNAKCGPAKCFQNIMTGKCTDEYVKNMIGKKFFEAKYIKRK